ncbi:hypothetical protein GYMLUDRAFT_465303 [Collybiopsis luxurians FD-317 M1]|uniref:Uncharacterized protein n=1 Tax=Collybiopsis luxurians FD-317 M1 TaxID=944289 RepID=A0A0D0C5C7_9AGAR|nr:hypothetical protein GYMLUDRAFT_465303 [Collybiopsis luxurians FD-317 M1]
MYHHSCSSSSQNSPLLTQGSRSPDSFPAPATPSTPNEYRWSDVIPPKTALKFAVIWDEEDFVAFSGGELLDDCRTEELLIASPTSPSDACSQVLSVGPSTIPLSDKSSTLMYFREDMGSVLDPTPLDAVTPRNRMLLGRTQTSSTMDGLDVYLRGSLLGQAHRNNHYYSCLENLDGEFDFDPRTSFAKGYKQTGGKGEAADDTVTDEGFYEVLIAPRQRHVSTEHSARRDLKVQSTYSESTTATSDFVSIDADDASSTWSTVDPPEYSLYTGLCIDQCPPMKRRLRKPRPADIPAPPSEVLQRQVFSHQVSLPPARSIEAEDARSPHRKKSLVKLVQQISKKHSKSAPVDVEQWICIEVSHEVRQRCM